MTMSSPISNENPSYKMFVDQCLTSSIAASVAIVPPFYGFIAKSEYQCGKPKPRIHPLIAIKAGLKAAPIIGPTVGIQMFAQAFFEQMLAAHVKHDSFVMLISTTFVAGISAPALAICNGLTMRKTAIESLRTLSARQTSAIMTRELGFLLGLRISGPAGEYIKKNCGDSKHIEYLTALISGMLGSVMGHPADTILTRKQNGLKITYHSLMKGVIPRALAIGVFSLGFKALKDLHKTYQTES